jgi:hypothetical protein
MGLERVHLGLNEAEAVRTVGDMSVSVVRVEGAVVEHAIGSTAYHEACHALAALLLGMDLIEASDVPGPGYGGYTLTGEFHPTMAAAAEAMGCDGTSHDLWQIAARGYSPDVAVAHAQALLWGREEELRALATEIQTERTATGTDLADAKGRVTEDVVEVTYTDAEGREVVERKTLRRGEVYLDIPRELPDAQR